MFSSTDSCNTTRINSPLRRTLRESLESKSRWVPADTGANPMGGYLLILERSHSPILGTKKRNTNTTGLCRKPAGTCCMHRCPHWDTWTISVQNFVQKYRNTKTAGYYGMMLMMTIFLRDIWHGPTLLTGRGCCQIICHTWDPPCLILRPRLMLRVIFMRYMIPILPFPISHLNHVWYFSTIFGSLLVWYLYDRWCLYLIPSVIHNAIFNTFCDT